MLAELGMVLGDPGHRLADRAGHSGSGALGRGRGSSTTTTQPERARQLLDQEVTFGVGLGGPLGVADGTGLLDVVLDLGQASAVGVLGLGVEALAGVAECRPRQALSLRVVQGLWLRSVGAGPTKRGRRGSRPRA
jgi:hypothetical protein